MLILLVKISFQDKQTWKVIMFLSSKTFEFLFPLIHPLYFFVKHIA